jgi:uncharacterized peroxidase-related enzyme
MPLIHPLRRQDVPQHEATFHAVENALGVLPNATLTMARWPALIDTFAQMNAVVMGDGAVDGQLKQMVAAVVSSASGCSYCHAHTAHVGLRRGVDLEKLEHLWDFELSDLFTDAERAALRIAQGAGLTPNSVSDADREELRRHYSDLQIVEIVAVIANFGFLNRWNDTMATTLEASPLQWARSHLAEGGWEAGSHAPEPTEAQSGTAGMIGDR